MTWRNVRICSVISDIMTARDPGALHRRRRPAVLHDSFSRCCKFKHSLPAGNICTVRWARHVTRTGETKNICEVVMKQRKGRVGNLNADRSHTHASVYSRPGYVSALTVRLTNMNIMLEVWDCVHWIKPGIRFPECGYGISGSFKSGNGRHFQCHGCSWWICKNVFVQLLDASAMWEERQMAVYCLHVEWSRGEKLLTEMVFVWLQEAHTDRL